MRTILTFGVVAIAMAHAFTPLSFHHQPATRHFPTPRTPPSPPPPPPPPPRHHHRHTSLLPPSHAAAGESEQAQPAPPSPPASPLFRSCPEVPPFLLGKLEGLLGLSASPTSIQAAALQTLRATEATGSVPPSALLVAPTGTGKTLAYLLLGLQVCVWVGERLRTRTRTRVRTARIHTRARTRACAHICARTHMHMHMHAHSHTHTHTHTHTAPRLTHQQ